MHIQSCTPYVHAPARLRGSGGPRRSLATHGTRTTAPRGRRPPTPCTGMAGRALAPTAPYLRGEQGGSAFSRLALWRLLSAPEHASGRPGAPASLSQSAAWAAMVGPHRPCFPHSTVPAGGPRVQRVAGQEDEVSSGGGTRHVQGHRVAQRGRGGPGWSTTGGGIGDDLGEGGAARSSTRGRGCALSAPPLVLGVPSPQEPPGAPGGGAGAKLGALPRGTPGRVPTRTRLEYRRPWLGSQCSAHTLGVPSCTEAPGASRGGKHAGAELGHWRVTGRVTGRVMGKSLARAALCPCGCAARGRPC